MPDQLSAIEAVRQAADAHGAIAQTAADKVKSDQGTTPATSSTTGGQPGGK